jgi:hypothetical protein
VRVATHREREEHVPSPGGTRARRSGSVVAFAGSKSTEEESRRSSEDRRRGTEDRWKSSFAHPPTKNKEKIRDSKRLEWKCE